jgi:hypothetical protein
MATDAEKVKMYREKAKDTSIPQEVRNTYLDRANELERKAYEDTKKAPATPAVKLAKGGAVKKTPAKAPAKGGKPVVAIMVGMAKPKGKTMMNKGGMAKKGKC